MKHEVLYGSAVEKLAEMPAGIADCCVTSPPYYGLRNYDTPGEIGHEETPEKYIAELVEVFRAVRRVLRDDGTLFVNIGDSYCNAKGRSHGSHDKNPAGKWGELRPQDRSLPGYKAKDLIGIPWMLAFALRADGWFLRNEIIWHKPNGMPQPAKDRFVVVHEQIFMLSKSRRYFFDKEAAREPEVCGRVRGPALHKDLKSTNGNAGLSKRQSDGKRGVRSVWSVNTKPLREKHAAAYPQELIEPAILAGSRLFGVVLDPFMGSWSTAVAAQALGRSSMGVEINERNREIIDRRLAAACAEYDHWALV